MKKTKLFITVFIIVAAITIIMTFSDDTPDAKTIEGQPIYLSDYEGKWLVINYWASWCHPCYEEFPQLNALYEKYKNKNVVILGVNYEQMSDAELKHFAQKFNLQYPMLNSVNNPAQLLGLGDVEIVPTSYIISPDRKVTKILMGPQRQKDFELAMGFTP